MKFEIPADERAKRLSKAEIKRRLNAMKHDPDCKFSWVVLERMAGLHTNAIRCNIMEETTGYPYFSDEMQSRLSRTFLEIERGEWRAYLSGRRHCAERVPVPEVVTKPTLFLTNDSDGNIRIRARPRVIGSQSMPDFNTVFRK